MAQNDFIKHAIRFYLTLICILYNLTQPLVETTECLIQFTFVADIPAHIFLRGGREVRWLLNMSNNADEVLIVKHNEIPVTFTSTAQK